jgi:glucosamine--fructose-6-phosphate aminotransferase (isomerizing)
MCGIVGILGTEPVADDIVDSLRRLEYRGYDSAGVATLEDGKLARVRAEGKLKNLAGKLAAQSLSRPCRHWPHALGHTRSADRAQCPSTPGWQCCWQSCRRAQWHHRKLPRAARCADRQGRNFETETDTEVVAHAVAAKHGRGPFTAGGGSCRLCRHWRAHSALPFLFEGSSRSDDRRAQGFAAGRRSWRGQRRDVYRLRCLCPFALHQRITYLEEGDVAFISRAGLTVEDESGATVERPQTDL